MCSFAVIVPKAGAPENWRLVNVMIDNSKMTHKVGVTVEHVTGLLSNRTAPTSVVNKV